MTHRRVPVPVSVSRTAWVLAAVTGALYIVGRTTGSGWVVVMLCGAIALIVVGAAWPALALAVVGVEADAGGDATVGRPGPVRIVVTGRSRALRLRTLVPPSGWVHVDAPTRGELTATPEMRGVFTAIVVQVRSAAPLGFVTWSRRLTVPAARALEVAPAPADVAAPPVSSGAQGAADDALGAALGDEVTRGVREYAPGDPFRRVHWPATARSGAVMVRELDGPRHPQLGLVVDLRPSGDAAERAASRAAGIAYDALRRGIPVVLHTSEADGPTVTDVITVRDAGRCLARAVDGPLPTVGFAPGTTVVRVAP